ncbi:MAG: fibronectin type III domain-containing protein, partial [Deltaproteobacteria bacterium]
MATINKPFSRLIKSVVFVLAMAIVLCGLQPVTLAQTKTTPGGLTITWYSAKRLVYSDTETKKSSDGRLLNSMLNQAMNVGAKTTVAIDTAKSNQAYNSQDRSVRLGSEPINELSFDLTKWMPALAIPPAMELRDKYVWGEVTGYIRMPRTGYLIINQINDTPADFVFETMGTDYGQWTNVNDPSDRRIVQNEAADKWVFEEGTMIPFRMCIGNIGMDPSDPDQKFKLKLVTFIGMEDKGEPVGMDAFYANVGLDQMKESFFFNPKDFTLRFDSANVNFPVDSYEYGIYNGVLTTSMVHKASGFQTLHLGINHLTPDSGTIIVRSKDQFTGPYIELGIASLAPPQKVALTRRTSTAAYLSWEVPDQEVPEGYKIKYDIYRRYIGELADQSFLPTESGGEFGKVGSTTSLTYTDQGLDPNALYEYYVIAGYPTGFSFPSDKVRSDAVDMEGLPYTPQNLTVVGNQSANKVDLNLRWTASYSPPGIKEYVIYRLRNRPPEVYQSREVTDESGQTSYVMGEAKEVIPQEIARTVSPNYIDSGLDLGDQCDYYVQAIDKKGAKSRISPRVSISVVGVIPPTAPRDLKVGDVQRQGENTEYVFPESNRFRNAVLGPEREVVLRWLPSTDNSKVVGYNVYRVQYGNSTASANPKPANSPVPNQIKVDPSSDAANRGMGRDAAGTSTKTDPVVPGNDRPLLGTTKDTTFVDKGLEFGSAYEYYVEAVDDDGNKVGDSVFVGTKKSTLAGCTITGAGDVDLDPVFAYYHNDYTLQVDNAVKSISLSTEKTDPQATVTVNGKRAEGDKFGPLALEPGENTFLIEVEPRSADTRYTVPETMSYSLKVTRTNTANPPVLTLPASATVLNEGSAYKAVGHIKFKDDLVWTGTVDYGDGTGAQALAVKADGSLSLEHTYLDNGKYKINVSFRYQDLGLIQGTVDVTVENVAPALISEGIQDEITV